MNDKERRAMAKEEVELKCVHNYTPRDGSESPKTYEAGKKYKFSRASAAHMLRKVVNVRKDGVYAGDAPCFIDEAAQANAAKAEAQAEKADASKGKEG